MTIRITREQIGRAVGVLILFGLAAALSAGVVSWVVWDINPSNWSPAARGWCAALVGILLILRWLYGVVEVGDEE